MLNINLPSKPPPCNVVSGNLSVLRLKKKYPYNCSETLKIAQLSHFTFKFPILGKSFAFSNYLLYTFFVGFRQDTVYINCAKNENKKV